MTGTAAAFATHSVYNRPFVYVGKGESLTAAVDRYHRETGRTGWCIIVMRRSRGERMA
jgi:hypothetical protein